MIFLHKFLNVLVTLPLLSSPVSTLEQASQLSLWGKVADFTPGRSHWSLRVSVPTLRELTVCFNLRFQVLNGSPWTAFIYRHPEVHRVELGLGGRRDCLVVWMFGKEWTTSWIDLREARWYSLCLTWSHEEERPTLYVDGGPVDLVAAHHSASVSPSCLTLYPNGTLTLGATHILADGKIHVVPFTSLLGKLSLFRLWGRKRSRQEVISLNCTEGDLVKWETDNWDTQSCPPRSDSTLQCEWSTYKVRLIFSIFRNDGNTTELYTARDLAHQWLRKVLPTGIYLPRVSVSKVTSETRHQGGPTVSAVSDKSSAEDSFEKTSHEFPLKRWANPNFDSFHCLVHVNVIPCLDVAAVQREMHMDLKDPYYDPGGQLVLLAHMETIHTTPVESFSAPTISPHVTVVPLPVTTTPFTPASYSTATSKMTTNQPTSAAAATSFTRQPANISELYFEVNANVSITGDGEAEQVLATWLNSSLPDDMMMVLDLQLLPNAHRDRRHPNLPSSRSTTAHVSTFKASRESCVFQVQVKMSLADTQEMMEQIRHLLLMPYSNGSVSIATEDVQISRILILMCDAEAYQTRKGLFKWPTTSGGKNATWPCPKNPHRNATRHCKLCLSTKWMDPDLQACPLVVETIPDLDHVDVTAENAPDVVEMIEDLLSDHSGLNYKELETVLNKLEDVVSVSVVTPNLGQALINVISDILESNSDLLPFTNTILNLTEAVGDRTVGYEGSSTLVAPAVAISMVDVTPGEFDNLTFGVSSDRTGSNPEIFINRYPLNRTVAFISLPSVLQHSFPPDSPRIQFQFYSIPVLFKGSGEGLILNSFVVSASVTNATSPIRDLEQDVEVTLHHLNPNTLNQDIKCVYWNFNKNNGHGGWDGYGCRKYDSSPEYTTCLCDHLTHFGVLLDVSRTQVDQANKQILTIITYIGCGISSLFLGITVLIYTAFEKLRRDYPSQILINLSLALLGLNLLFLVNSWLSSWGLHGLCVAVASTLHYFLLASLTWMGLEAVNMYFALVKVFNVYVPSYMLKFCALGWGMPLVVCALVLIVDREAYGGLYTDPQTSVDDFCWLQDDVTFYVTVVAYALLVFLFNIAVFAVVLIQIRHMRANSPAGSRRGLMQDLRGIASLTLLLGLTWTAGFFSWGPARVVMLYLFTGLNTLQGVFIFLFHCLMKENVRKQLRIHLCLGRFRLEEYSDWSHSASVRPPGKPRAVPPRPSVPSVHSVKSSSTDSTSASSGSSQRDSTCRRPNLGLFVNSLALPWAQKALQVGERCFPRGDEPGTWLEESLAHPARTNLKTHTHRPGTPQQHSCVSHAEQS